MSAHRRFAHVLALKLGMTVGELSERMTAREYIDWIAFLSEDPGLHDTADMSHDQIAAAFGAKR